MNRTIVDITQLAHWSGKITGIPRVMNELAVRFRQEDPHAIFVSWVKEIQEFCELDLEKTLAQRGHGIVYLRGTQQLKPFAESIKKESPTAHTQVILPSSLLKKGAIKVLKKGIAGTARVSPRLSESLDFRLKTARMQSYKKVVFAKGDTLFIPWGEWWDGNFITKLEQIHKDHGVKLVQILHDMAPIVVPQFSNSGNATQTYPIYCRRILPLCSLVLSVSENSKRDALKWLKENKLKTPKIEVFRLGEDIRIAKSQPVADPAFKSSGLKGQDFLLFVGTIELKKNHLLMYYVYKLALSRGIELPKLVILGRLGWMTEATYELMTKDPEIKDKFIFLLNAGDEELSWVYDHCLFSILPSFYEGWGIPIAESVARGVPCLCSNTSSMTEIAEEYVQHFNPYSAEECLAGIQKWLNPAALKAARKKVTKYHQFSWDESFAQVKAFMEEIT